MPAGGAVQQVDRHRRPVLHRERRPALVARLAPRPSSCQPASVSGASLRRARLGRRSAPCPTAPCSTASVRLGGRLPEGEVVQRQPVRLPDADGPVEHAPRRGRRPRAPSPRRARCRRARTATGRSAPSTPRTGDRAPRRRPPSSAYVATVRVRREAGDATVARVRLRVHLDDDVDPVRRRSGAPPRGRPGLAVVDDVVRAGRRRQPALGSAPLTVVTIGGVGPARELDRGVADRAGTPGDQHGATLPATPGPSRSGPSSLTVRQRCAVRNGMPSAAPEVVVGPACPGRRDSR